MNKSTSFSVLPVLLVLALLLQDCAREVIIDLPEEAPKIVAVCHFNENEPFRVRVTISQPVYASSTPITPETVDISISEDGLFLDKLFRKFTPEGELYWESRDTGTPGLQYAMVARVAGYPSVTAASKLPLYAGLEPIVAKAEEMKDVALADGRRELRIPLELKVSKMPAANRFFAFHLIHELAVYDYLVDPPVFDYSIIPDSTFFLADGRTLSLLHNIPEPAVLINSNFWNEGRETLHLVARIPYDPANNERPRQISVEWRTLSEEYYRYHLSVARQGSSLPLSDPDAVFNNIDGGYGNFSGYTTHTYTVELPQ